MSTNDATPAVAAQLARVGLRGDAGHTETLGTREGLTLARVSEGTVFVEHCDWRLPCTIVPTVDYDRMVADLARVTAERNEALALVTDLSTALDYRENQVRLLTRQRMELTAERDQARNERDAARMAGS